MNPASDSAACRAIRGRPAAAAVTEPAAQVTSLVKRYGEIEAVRGISFEVQPGSHPGLRPRQRPAAGPARDQHRLAPGDLRFQTTGSGRSRRWCSRLFLLVLAPGFPRSPAVASAGHQLQYLHPSRRAIDVRGRSRLFSRRPRLCGTGSSGFFGRCWSRRSAGRRSLSGNASAADSFDLSGNHHSGSGRARACTVRSHSYPHRNRRAAALSFTLTAFGVMMAARIT